MRDIGRRVSRRPWIQTLIYGLLWVLATFVISLPFDIYAGFVREHQYGLATQTFAGWFGDALKSLMVSAILVPVVIALIYGAVRRAGDRWWVWASGGAFVLILFVLMLAPVFVDPLFNDYKPLREGAVREAVLSLARANQIPTDNVVEFDASRQTTRISANVSGFLGTTRVALNDNLLNKSSLPEIKAVMGHEMGHYVLNHGLRLTVYLTLVIAFALWVVHRTMDWALARWGSAFRARRTHRSRCAAARGRDLLAVFPAGDAADQLDRASGRSRSRRVRAQRGRTSRTDSRWRRCGSARIASSSRGRSRKSFSTTIRAATTACMGR